MIDLNLLKQGDLVRKEMRRGPTSIIDFYKCICSNGECMHFKCFRHKNIAI